jgi:probable HAF family extracellular repeat protein
VPGSTLTSAYEINDSGKIVGTYEDSGGRFHGFLLSGGVYTAIDPPGSTGGVIASGINTSGQIVGGYIGVGGVQHGYLLRWGELYYARPTRFHLYHRLWDQRLEQHYGRIHRYE